eukprot:CAMPEP_0195280818 /NCGR_PEP_ID=MMETSP0707-20130614/361_1 /TAXON_ID=33640 /ORGANISM="Asterionellopsis glacialis, Strain CCMP134" /LENGTH=772 /DNA_ID=CAMNT_0040339627 /DNA_START=45 /DNA_END=2363 /DNA_ORIENTATION=-
MSTITHPSEIPLATPSGVVGSNETAIVQSPMTVTGSSSSAAPHALSMIAIWDMDANQVDQWIHSTTGLFPQAGSTKSPQDLAQQNEVAQCLFKNLMTAITAVLPKPSNDRGADNEEPPDGPPTKRIKTEPTSDNNTNESTEHDIYKIWFGASDELSGSVGGVLAELSVWGLINGMSGVPGGLVNEKGVALDPTTTTRTVAASTVLPTAGNITFSALKNLAFGTRRAVTTRAEHDVLITTPLRIQQMLCPENTLNEFKAIRKRVYDTVVLGKGLNQGSTEKEEDLPVAARVAVHDLDKFKKCKVCGNNDQSLFVLDRKNGDVICSNCGTVATESLMHEGSQFRKFEGEVDRNHHGDAANTLMSDAYNMSTSLGGVAVTTGAGKEGFGTQKRGLETILKNAHAYTEMNISQFGKGERKTRVGYKDKQKRDAFIQMAHVGDALNLHEAVVQRSKELFAGFRDDRELVQQFKGVIAACLCEAFDQLSRDGQRILKQMESETNAVIEEDPEKPGQPSNARASRRNELHSAKMAGKGGLLLDFAAVSKENGSKVKQEKTDASAALGTVSSTLEAKPAPSWDLEDCRSWLCKASQTIAQNWDNARKKNPDVKNIPVGTKGELEGKLVERALSLCDQLEAELSGKKNGSTNTKNKRVVTPRVQGMGSLSIRWQHSHERGSGGKGGVGNSGRSTLGTKAGERPKNKRTAGQVLILKTAKRLGTMVNDPIIGNAFHKEVRSLVGRQEARKRKELRDEAARQRMQQMQRKPWLQAKAEASIEK